MDVKQRLINLVDLKDRLRKLISRYEKDLFMHVIDEAEPLQDDGVAAQLRLMRQIEIKVYKKVIYDLEKMLNSTEISEPNQDQ